MFDYLIIFVWSFLILSFLFYLHNPYNKYTNIGFSQDLFVLGFPIDNIFKYYCVIIFIFINTVIKKLWYKPTTHRIYHNGIFELLSYCNLSFISIIYYWIDWIITLNICFAQLDLFILIILFDFTGHIIFSYYKNRIDSDYNIFNHDNCNNHHKKEKKHSHKKTKCSETTFLNKDSDILSNYNSTGFVYM
jgi:hypothetical protein